MNVKTVKLSRKYNLGNYEMLEVGLEAELSEVEGANSQGPLSALRKLEKVADQYYQMGRFQKDEPPKQEAPKPQPKLAPSPQPKALERDPVILSRFPPELQEHLKKASTQEILVEYISADKFAPIAKKCTELGYTRKPAKSGSRWVKQ